MLALDMSLPPSYTVDTWGLIDAGHLGPAIRFVQHIVYSSFKTLIGNLFCCSACQKEMCRLHHYCAFQIVLEVTKIVGFYIYMRRFPEPQKKYVAAGENGIL